MISGEKIAKENENVPINTSSFLSNPILPSPPLEGLGEVFTYPLGTMGPQEQPLLVSAEQPS